MQRVRYFGFRIGSHRAARVALLVGVVPSAIGCGRLLGADEYGFAEPCPAGTKRTSDGTCGTTNDCGLLKIPDPEAEGGCAPVGVPVERCPDGFSPEGGGCTARIPDGSCPEVEFATPGLAECVPLSVSCDGAEFPEPPDPSTVPPARVTYVSAAQTSGTPDGSVDNPWRSIRDALNQLGADGGAILVGPGEYHEDVEIKSSNLSLIACNSATIHGSGEVSAGYPCGENEPKAAVCIAPGAEVTLQGLAFTGPGDGIAVVGASVSAGWNRIYDTGRYGIRVAEANGPGGEKIPASLSAYQLRIHRATEAGVMSTGASVELNFVDIGGTRTFAYGGHARGVSVHPAGDLAAYGPPSKPDASDETPTRPTLEIHNSLIAGNREAGVWVAGAKSAVIDTSFIGSSKDRGEPAGAGIVVETSLPSGSPCSATIDRVEIAGTSDVGIDVHNATVEITETTIRDTRPRTSDGCSGQGVRVRADRDEVAEQAFRESGAPDVSIERSLIEGARQAAVHNLNARVELSTSILRDTTPQGVPEICAPAFGDGLTVERTGELQASALVDHCLVTGNARAGIANGFGDVEVTGSVFDCNSQGIVQAGSARPVDALCGCDRELAPCTVESKLLDSWIARPTDGVWAGSTEPLEVCTLEFPATAAQNLRAWVLDRPEIPSAVADEFGCWRMDGAPSTGDVLIAVWRVGHSGALVNWLAGRLRASPNIWGALLDPRAFVVYDRSDLQKGFLFVQLPAGFSVKTDRGTEPLYLEENFVPAPELKRASNIGWAVVSNLESGWVTATLSPPEGGSCALLRTNYWGQLVSEDPIKLKAWVEPGFIANLNFVCRPPGSDSGT